ncbi:transposase [Roseiconus lacunae]|uniref:transposase n=1 Tax=Roseiconus lacunae TaxID=2605694 RepID=UPI001F3F8D19|nr:transposase [Roseiconus lacunae]
MTDSMSGKALAAGTPKPTDPITVFITWTTYGTWLPGDSRGWRKQKAGDQPPQPLLADWCRDRLKEKPVILNQAQRREVEQVIRRHANIRGWELHAVSVRSNHVHVVATSCAAPKTVRDQLKANATTALRRMPDAISQQKVWTKGGDMEFIDTDEDLEQVVVYVTEAQDRMERGK